MIYLFKDRGTFSFPWWVGTVSEDCVMKLLGIFLIHHFAKPLDGSRVIMEVLAYNFGIFVVLASLKLLNRRDCHWTYSVLHISTTYHSYLLNNLGTEVINRNLFCWFYLFLHKVLHLSMNQLTQIPSLPISKTQIYIYIMQEPFLCWTR